MSSQALPRSKRSGMTNLIIWLTVPIAYLCYHSVYRLWSSGQHPDTRPISDLKILRAICNGEQHFKRVAIIGAGSAGTSTAYYLARAAAGNEFDPCLNITITIYERNGYIGGRSTIVYPYSSRIQQDSSDKADLRQQPPLELGGSVFVKVNTNLLHAAEALNLTIQSAGRKRPNISPYSLGVWDGASFRFLSAEKDSWWYELGKLLYKYGLAPLRTQRAMKDVVSHFQKMYSEPLFPWESLTNVVRAVELDGVSATTGSAFLAEKGISDGFAQDLIQASTRVNYAQNLEQIHGVETMVCMAAEGGTMSIQGGNWQIFAGMAAASGAQVRLNTTVLSLSSLDISKTSARFRITSTASSSIIDLNQNEDSDLFDDVVLAAPLQFSHIDTTNLTPELQENLPSPIRYVRLHVTLLATSHRLSPSFFGVASYEEIPETILTTLPSTNSASTQTSKPDSHRKFSTRRPPQFFSISTLRNLTNPNTGHTEYAYKIFSAEQVDPKFLASLFGLQADEAEEEIESAVSRSIPWIYRHVWNSYPYLDARRTFDGPALGTSSSGLWYTSGIESFISTMETSSLAGRNVAALLAREWATEWKSDASRLKSASDSHADV